MAHFYDFLQKLPFWDILLMYFEYFKYHSCYFDSNKNNEGFYKRTHLPKKHCQLLWIIIGFLPRTYSVATPFLPRSYSLAIGLLLRTLPVPSGLPSACYPLTTPLLARTFCLTWYVFSNFNSQLSSFPLSIIFQLSLQSFCIMQFMRKKDASATNCYRRIRL